MNTRWVFIHSLFRSGSTYLFNVFRRSQGGYWCYQEPLHEVPLAAKHNPEMLLTVDVNASKDLRHPSLTKAYYQELYDVFDSWRDILIKEAIYDHAFRDDDGDGSIAFFRALIDAAKGFPVIQECRTSWRISGLKRALGGTHLYLWRNPWDQWWSYQLNDYFDAANMLIINASEHPRAIACFRREIGFQEFRSEHIGDQFAHFASRPVSPQISYRAFYLLWCLGLQEGRRYAEQLVSIDRLSDDSSYRAELLQRFDLMGLKDIDLSDCRIPQAVYGQEDLVFFCEQESSVHELLLRSGWSREDLAMLLSLRKQYAPRLRQWAPHTEEDISLARDAERARSLARRFASRVEAFRRTARDQAQMLQKECDAARAKIDEVEHASRRWQAAADVSNRELQALYESRSWRITWPLRKVMEAVRRVKALLKG